MKIKVKRTLNGWTPADEESTKYHSIKFRLNDIYNIDISKIQDQRTAELNGLYWSILRVVIKNQERYINTQQLHYIMKKCLLPLLDVWNPVTQKTEELVSSTAFDKLKNEPFKAYFKDSLEFIKWYVLPGVTEYELIESACNRMSLMEENRNWINENYKQG